MISSCPLYLLMILSSVYGVNFDKGFSFRNIFTEYFLIYVISSSTFPREYWFLLVGLDSFFPLLLSLILCYEKTIPYLKSSFKHYYIVSYTLLIFARWNCLLSCNKYCSSYMSSLNIALFFGLVCKVLKRELFKHLSRILYSRNT